MAIDPARAKSLFLAASEIADPAERAAYLDRECGEEQGFGTGGIDGHGITSKTGSTLNAPSEAKVSRAF